MQGELLKESVELGPLRITQRSQHLLLALRLRSKRRCNPSSLGSGLLRATAADGSPLVEGRRITAVTDKQVRELGIDSTPHHPETELRKVGAEFESASRFRDALANHWVVDGNLVTGQNQNAAPMVAREMLRLVTERQPAPV